MIGRRQPAFRAYGRRLHRCSHRPIEVPQLGLHPRGIVRMSGQSICDPSTIKKATVASGQPHPTGSAGRRRAPAAGNHHVRGAAGRAPSATTHNTRPRVSVSASASESANQIPAPAKGVQIAAARGALLRKRLAATPEQHIDAARQQIAGDG